MRIQCNRPDLSVFSPKWGGKNGKNGPRILIGYSRKSKMATSGSDETELDSESVIDPDSLSHCSLSHCSLSHCSLSHCSDMPPVTKKRRTPVSKKVSVCKFKRSWSLPQHITFSSKGDSFAYCRLCSSHFSVSHGGFNDVKRHVSGSVHQQRQKDSCGTSGIATFFQKDALQRSSRKTHQITNAMSFWQKCK